MSSIQLWRKHNQFSHTLGKTGTIRGFTKIHAAATGFESGSSFFTGMIELANGQKVFGEIIASSIENIKMEAVVVAVLRRGTDVLADDAVDYAIKWQVQEN